MLQVAVYRFSCCHIAVTRLTALVFFVNLIGASGNAVAEKKCLDPEHDKKPKETQLTILLLVKYVLQ